MISSKLVVAHRGGRSRRIPTRSKHYRMRIAVGTDMIEFDVLSLPQGGGCGSRKYADGSSLLEGSNAKAHCRLA
jgi:hypothetical protein